MLAWGRWEVAEVGGEEVGVAVAVEPLLSGAEERTTRRGGGQYLLLLRTWW